MATVVDFGRITCSPDFARFVQGGVAKTFRYATCRMAFPLKGSSEISVDGVAYRWRIRSRPTYDQQIDAPMTFAVQAASDPQCVLHVTTDRVHPDAWCSDGPVAVTPQLVADCIRTALADGWEPHSAGSAFKLSAVIPR